jgi:DNA polymerase (family 10)
VNNREVATVFENIADLLEIRGEQVFKVLAYRRAAEAILGLGRDINAVSQQGDLETIPGVGKAISAKIEELLRTGKLGFYEELKEEVPESLVEVLKVGNVGPKKAARFWKELGITTLGELEAAAREGRLRTLSGMGDRSEARILEGIEALKRRQSGRISIGTARPIAEALLAQLRRVPGVVQAEAAGSLRRWRETVGDIDLLVGVSRAGDVPEAFASFPEVAHVTGKGETKVSVELVDGTRVQLWVHPAGRFGTALQYATGSQAHNVRLRELALDRGLSLSEHGFKAKDGSEILCAEEAEVYRQLGLPWIPPELREDRGEIQAALEGRLPHLVTNEDIVGELHAHSDWSDGSVTILAMAQAAREAGLSYLVISDHTQSLGVANGLSVER